MQHEGHFANFFLKSLATLLVLVFILTIASAQTCSRPGYIGAYATSCPDTQWCDKTYTCVNLPNGYTQTSVASGLLNYCTGTNFGYPTGEIHNGGGCGWKCQQLGTNYTEHQIQCVNVTGSGNSSRYDLTAIYYYKEHSATNTRSYCHYLVLEPDASYCASLCSPSNEICDGSDNDCDGEIDEDCFSCAADEKFSFDGKDYCFSFKPVGSSLLSGAKIDCNSYPGYTLANYLDNETVAGIQNIISKYLQVINSHFQSIFLNSIAEGLFIDNNCDTLVAKAGFGMPNLNLYNDGPNNGVVSPCGPQQLVHYYPLTSSQGRLNDGGGPNFGAVCESISQTQTNLCYDGTSSTIINHGGTNWVITTNQELSGKHINVNDFNIALGVTVTIKKFDGTKCGLLDVNAKSINIFGTLNANGSGYGGGGGGGGGAAGVQASGTLNVGASGGNAGVGAIAGATGGNLASGSTCDRGRSIWAGAGGNGGNGGGTFAGAGGSGGAGGASTCSTANGGTIGTSGNYCNGTTSTCDTSTDYSINLGSGGGGGGGGSGNTGYACAAAGGGGAAGNAGGGAIKLNATNSFYLVGNIYTKGLGAQTENGSNGGCRSDWATPSANFGPGKGGSFSTSGTSSAGSGGSCGCYWGAGGDGASGGSGAGGGVLINSPTTIISLSGKIDSRSAIDNVSNGGTIKIFSCNPAIAGTISSGRTFIKNECPTLPTIRYCTGTIDPNAEIFSLDENMLGLTDVNANLLVDTNTSRKCEWKCKNGFTKSGDVCIATTPINPSCGSAKKSYIVGETFPQGGLCTTGNPTPTNPVLGANVGSTTNWKCTYLTNETNCTVSRINATTTPPEGDNNYPIINYDFNSILFIESQMESDGNVLVTLQCSKLTKADLNFIETIKNNNLQISPKIIDCNVTPKAYSIKVIQSVGQKTLLTIQADISKSAPNCTTCARQATMLYETQKENQSIPDNSIIGIILILIVSIALITKKAK